MSPRKESQTPTGIHRTWWKESSIYQIYPSSFQSHSPNRPTGTIRGITSHLSYIQSLGTDTVWLCPILASPQIDMGYDISDYRDIHEGYGTMEDHDELIRELHARKMKYVMDLVVNHTSDQHEWFKKSRSSRGKGNEFRDWYIWRPAKYDNGGQRQPPNNWLSYFGGSAWQWDETAHEYYLHLFAPSQPDLNWENPSVVSAVHSMIRFWLDRGVDGFRMDVINFISKEPGLPNAPVTDPTSPWQSAIALHSCGPRLHEFLQGIGAILKEYDAFSVGEMPGVGDEKEVMKSVGQEREELNMIFHFELVSIDGQTQDKFLPRNWTLQELKRIISKWQAMMLTNHGWNALYLENHDQPRSISRFASDAPKYRKFSAKMLATFLALQSGTPYIYQGQEIGQINLPRSWGLDKYRDIETLNHWRDKVLVEYPEDKEFQDRMLREYRKKGRDNARTPMQWDGKSRNAGFTGEATQPWMDVHPDYTEWNVENQIDDPDSVFSYWKAVLALRKELKDIFVYGDFQMLDPEGEESVVFIRSADERNKALVVMSFKDYETEWQVPEGVRSFLQCPVKLKNYEDEPQLRRGGGEGGESSAMILRPFEALVYVSSGGSSD
ncbi:hypothetical protein EPUS_00115 [Endocarpon pusillum Z07020]|uniref:Glycosyl hydrolase family 13 catalytic domain-containing protein n=1 Tax=Endocarpon pusillum (strain Z07020 / HMAS-L-300199) TaxID=1263415 RepID=U1GSG1_ENDPU|nr:uncharacterized protein EPUS_00115 [Endocarpon pusillum Z07020]ERF75323.1 hypothetical protein EPUS_00115 [Endocarpon pusillum Z07020]